MSPLVWDLGHIAAYEDLWLAHRFGGLPLLHPELADLYDAFETPRSVRGEIELLTREPALEYLEQTRRRTLQVIARHGVGDGSLHEMVIQHEHQHNETMLQTLELARLDGVGPFEAQDDRPAARGDGASTGRGGLETVEVPAGPFALGAPDTRFSYDNERPRHPVQLAAFRIGRTPVTNASWLSFAEGGGYERREWWSDEGWAWKEQYDIERPGGWTTASPAQRATDTDASLRWRGEPVQEWRCGAWQPLHPDRPVVHVSWFEADAFARAHGVRLPTEAEWEKAATWDRATGATGDWPWGDAPPRGGRANLFENGCAGCATVDAHPEGAAACGALGMIGDVWEWTASEFDGYPGFAAHPYPQYSQVFFRSGYRSLRGGSWATSRRVATPTFRNWDLPIRRQIFAGLRIAEDVT
jgi:iron(II)-dependent oxidoreductase